MHICILPSSATVSLLDPSVQALTTARVTLQRIIAGPTYQTLVQGPEYLGFGNVTGGWMGNGIDGTIKNTIPTSMTLAMLAWGMLEFPMVRFDLAGASSCWAFSSFAGC